jgi:hypothetical protein
MGGVLAGTVSYFSTLQLSDTLSVASRSLKDTQEEKAAGTGFRPTALRFSGLPYVSRPYVSPAPTFLQPLLHESAAVL